MHPKIWYPPNNTRSRMRNPEDHDMRLRLSKNLRSGMSGEIHNSENAILLNNFRLKFVFLCTKSVYRKVSAHNLTSQA
jgi:hypothetical protein